MNWYKHHLGDYDSHTAHLSWDEDLAYTRLLRVYYRREGPIPTAETYRLARAQTPEQCAAVDVVLSEFFVATPDGWYNKRASVEILTYQSQCATNRRVGMLGGRPKKTESVNSRNRTVTESAPESYPNRNPNQIPEPDTRKSFAETIRDRIEKGNGQDSQPVFSVAVEEAKAKIKATSTQRQNKGKFED